MNRKILLVSALIVVILLIMPPAVAQQSSAASLKAYYRDATSIVYDKTQGIYGSDYSYDEYNNKYSRFSTSRVLPDASSRNVIRIDGALEEQVWNDIEPFVVNLEPTSPWGGSIKSLSVRAINNGTWLFMAFEWKDATEDRKESSRIRRPDGAFFYNETHFYSDNMYIGWWMKDGAPTVKPWFNAHFAGTTKGRVPWQHEDPEALASLWIYKSYYTDDEAQKWPRPYFDALKNIGFGPFNGQELIIPYPHMITMYLNSTASYAITYMTHVSGCAFPDQKFFSYEVRANGLWKDGVYTLEVARPFKPHPLNDLLKATPRFEAGKEYWVYFGAGDGRRGENEEIGSISPWFTLTMESAPASPLETPIIFVAATLGIAAVAVSAIVLKRQRK